MELLPLLVHSTVLALAGAGSEFSFVVRGAFLAHEIEASAAAEPRAHPRLELRVIALAPIVFLITGAGPWLFNVVVKL